MRGRTSHNLKLDPVQVQCLGPLHVLPWVSDSAPLILSIPHLYSGNQTLSLTHELRGLDQVFSEYLGAGSI